METLSNKSLKGNCKSGMATPENSNQFHGLLQKGARVSARRPLPWKTWHGGRFAIFSSLFKTKRRNKDSEGQNKAG